MRQTVEDACPYRRYIWIGEIVGRGFISRRFVSFMFFLTAAVSPPYEPPAKQTIYHHFYI